MTVFQIITILISLAAVFSFINHKYWKLPTTIGSDSTALTEVLQVHGETFFGIGLACGLAQLFSAWMQGKIGASACRALSEGEGKGFTNMIIAMGICETVGLFGFLFLVTP